MLRSYCGSKIESLGYIEVDVAFRVTVVMALRLYVIKLLGKQWLRALSIKQINLNEITDGTFINNLCKEFPEVFCEKLDTCKRHISLELTYRHSPIYVRED